MKLELKTELLKFCSAGLNSIFLVLGLSVAGCAVWILFDKGSFLSVLSSVELHTVALGLLVIGGVVTAVGVIGCVGANGEHRFLLLIYLGFLIILVLAQLFVTLLLLINRNKIEQSLDAGVDQIILQYGGSSNVDTLMDNVQHYGKCCGRTGAADWLKNSYVHSLNLTGPDVLPCSCFSSYRRSFNSSWCSELLNFTEPLFGRGNSSYHQGCKQTLGVWLQENTLTIVSMDVSLMLIQVVQFAVMVSLYRALGRKASLKGSDLQADSDHTSLDHVPTDDLDNEGRSYAYVDSDGYKDSADTSNYRENADPTSHHDSQNHNQVKLELEPARGCRKASS